MNETCKFKDCVHWEILTNTPANCENCSKYHEQIDMYQPKINIGTKIHVKQTFGNFNIAKVQKIYVKTCYPKGKPVDIIAYDIMFESGVRYEIVEKQLEFKGGEYYYAV